MTAATQRIYKPDGNKKDVGKCSVRAYPYCQAFALPPCEDKQRKPAHVSRDICIHYGQREHPIYAKIVRPLHWGSTPYYIYKGKLAAGRYKINLRRRSLLHNRCTWIKVAKFDNTDSNVKKTSFETGRTTGLRSRSTKLILLPAHARTGLFREQR